MVSNVYVYKIFIYCAINHSLYVMDVARIFDTICQ